MVVVELTFAISSGILTAFSPCAVPFLPSLVSYYLKDEGGRLQGGKGSATFTLGLLLLLIPLVLGAIFAAALLSSYTAHFVLVGGLITLAMAFATWKGIPLFPRLGLRVNAEESRYRHLFLLGFAYIGAAVGCTPALTFGVAATAIGAGTVADSALIMMVFVISIVIPTILLSLIASEYKQTYAERIRSLIGPIKKVSLGLMFGMGVYLIIFYVLYTYAGVPLA